MLMRQTKITLVKLLLTKDPIECKYIHTAKNNGVRMMQFPSHNPHWIQTNNENITVETELLCYHGL